MYADKNNPVLKAFRTLEIYIMSGAQGDAISVLYKIMTYYYSLCCRLNPCAHASGE